MTKEDQLESDFEDCFDKHTRASEGGYGPDVTDKWGVWEAFKPLIGNFVCEFIEWKAKEGYVPYDGPDRWISPVIHNNDVLTTYQLYDQFIEQSIK